MPGTSSPCWTRCGLLIAVLGFHGCGYLVGNAYAPEVHSVHVPTFTSESFRRGFELQLTEAVQKQIQLRTPYRLADADNADTRLIGNVIDISKRLSNQNRFDDPRELELSIAVEVRWEDARTGRVLAEQRVPVDASFAQLITQMSFAPEPGQSLTTASHDAVTQLAQRIVGMMEMPW